MLHLLHLFTKEQGLKARTYVMPAGKIMPYLFTGALGLLASAPLPSSAQTTTPPICVAGTDCDNDNDYVLNCAKCAEVSKDAICFNIKSATSYCAQTDITPVVGGTTTPTIQFNTLCMKCPAVAPTPGPTVTPFPTPIGPIR